MYCLDFLEVHHKEGEFRNCDKAVLGWSDLYYRLLGATVERKVVLGDVDLDRGLIIISLALDEFGVVEELRVESLLLDTLPLFLLKFVHVVEPLAASPHVDVFGCDARLLEELHIGDRLVADHDGLLQVEVDQYDDLLG